MNKRLILVVDDSKINRALLTKILSKDYRVHGLENGEQALDYIKEYCADISAILLDLNMPVLNGYEFLKARQNNKQYCNIPVIVQTTHSGLDAEIACLEMGATDFLTKPYSPKVILRRLENIITLRENENFLITVQHDSLTNLLNKEGFYIKARNMLNENPKKEYLLLCIDIVQFKVINQFTGYQNGDKVLLFVAEILKYLFKENSLIARFTGDRFQALIPKTPFNENYIDDTITEFKKNPPINIPISIQFGVYEIINKDLPIASMCDWSKMALDPIKGKYKQYFSTFTDDMFNKMQREQMIISEMDEAVSSRQFIVYYQPKLNINSEEIIGGEALVRWIHPQYGFMSPGDFIPIFEKNGFISKLDMYVWEEVCRQMREWIDNGKKIVPISVNVSRNDIFNSDLVANLKALIEKYNLSSDLLHLEITETLYAKDQNILADIVREFSNNGFIIEMDDFGSGYSSLNMLSEVPVDIIKLDLLFLNKQSAESNNNMSILKLIVNIAKEMKLDLIAEGVETDKDVANLKKIGCMNAQGYYYAKPMKAIEFENLLN
ncbi:MAG: EAL domain-containing protein [Sphaerochaetaceae bacterium]|nr:EAL domain-containing protein [Sphaerochaetaceae bacterium]